MKRAGNDFHTKYTYEKLLKIAKEKGGKLINTLEEYKELIKYKSPSRATFKWRCGNLEHGYFYRSPKSIREGRWCKKCDIEKGRDMRYKYPYERLHEMAKKHGGKLITTSKEYKNLIKVKRPMNVIIKWWCNNLEHEYFYRTPREVSEGRWCERCIEKRRKEALKKAKIIYTYERLQEMANENEGFLITSKNEYEKLINNKKPSKVHFEWWCKKKNHGYFKATPNNLREGSWCPECFRERQKEWQISRIGYTYEYLTEEALNRGGLLITTSKEFQKLIKNIKIAKVFIFFLIIVFFQIYKSRC